MNSFIMSQGEFILPSHCMVSLEYKDELHRMMRNAGKHATVVQLMGIRERSSGNQNSEG